ncbi:MAG TPA: hypothetical protein VGN42_07370 [Pirellulales bacterium]|nr:hypothetical protein [Pirellulales bacterium]
MRRCIFCFALLTTTLALANSAGAQTSFEMGELQGPVLYEGGVAPASYYGHVMQLPAGPNSNWGYSGTCCSNVWAGYCEANQGCRHCGRHRKAGCCKTSLWRRLMCARPKLFGNNGCCGQQGCGQARRCNCGACGCSSGAANCGGGDCGIGNYGPADGEGLDAAGAEEVMPLPPQTKPEKLPYDEAASPGDDDQSSVRKSWNMPRVTSSRVSSRR